MKLSSTALLTQVLGWGSLIVAAGASFYFAKQSINERRREQELRGDRSTEKLDCMYTRLAVCGTVLTSTTGRSKIAQSEGANPGTPAVVPASGAPSTPASGSEAVSLSVAEGGRRPAS